MTKAISKKKPDFWHSREGMVLQILVALTFVYIVASLAINSGSLIQYFVTFALLGFAINRIVKLFHK